MGKRDGFATFMNLEALQKKFNKRLKAKTSRKQEKPYIAPKDDYCMHAHKYDKPLIKRTSPHPHNTKMFGQK